MPSVSMTVNGTAVGGEIESRTLLVDFIREQLRLTGTHVGCDTSQCGACVVHVDGMSVKSCTMLALQAEGCHVETIESLADGDVLHPMQEAFREHHGLQCGFCTPGMVMTAVAMAQENPNLTETDVRHGLEETSADAQAIRTLSNQSSLALERCKAWEAKMYEFNFNRPESIADALAAITDADDGQFMAGGQTMIPVLKQRLAMPSDVVELAKIDDLRGITVDGGWGHHRGYDAACSSPQFYGCSRRYSSACGFGWHDR